MPDKVIADKTHLIKQLSLFSELEPGQIEFISHKTEFLEYKKDEFVYKEGDPQDAFYLIVSGRVRALSENIVGEFRVLEYLHRGSYFGILSLLTNEPHSVSIQIVNDSLIMRIAKEDFYAILKAIPHLGVHFSSILARRLKRKEAGQKIVFQSTIISVYGIRGGIGCTRYARGLAETINRETKKDVIFLDMSCPQGGDAPALELMAVFFDEVKVKNSIVKDKSGINMLRLACPPKEGQLKKQIAFLLSYLTSVFGYCVIDLPHEVGEGVVDILGQSDLVHIITNNDEKNINSSNNFITELNKVLREGQKKIKVIVNEMNGPLQDPKLLNCGIYATLADCAKNEREYKLALRRIARDIGEILVGLVLGSGAAWGLSHIGVIKELEREGIPIDIVAGSSMGAVIGAIWASGISGAEMEKIAIGNKKQFGVFSFKDLMFPIRGLISDKRALYFLRKYLGNKTFRDIRLPLKIVASNLNDAREIVIDSGRLIDAVRASISVPGIYEPVKYNGDYVIDGGVLDPLPVSVLLKMKVRKIIAVNVLPSPEDISKGLRALKERRAKQEAQDLGRKNLFGKFFFKIQKRIINFCTPNIMDVITSSIEWLEYSAAAANGRYADVVIHPAAGGWSWSDFLNPENFISLGEEACVRTMPRIKRLIEEE